MEKHANTFFPGDKVAEVKDGTKVAGHESGKVTDGDPTSGKVKVAWPDGREDWLPAEDLQKV